MKKMFFLSVLVFASVSQAFAAVPYFVEPMNCKGKIVGNTGQVHSSYFQIGMQLKSFLSRRADGKLASSLEVKNSYFGPHERVVFDPEHYSEQWFMGPLAREGKHVVRKNLSGRGDDLKLTVVETRVNGGLKRERLVGTYMNPNSVAGSYGYELQCVATVVAEPSTVVDNTRR
jgi:hypothetical protein